MKTTLVKTLVLVARYAALNLKLTVTTDRAKRFRMLGDFEKWCN